MRTAVLSLVPVLLTLAITPARADWVKVIENDASVRYVDPAVVGKEGQFLRVWALTDLKVRDANGVLSRRTLGEYDCKEHRARALSVTGYSGPKATGEVLFRSNSPGDWLTALPAGAMDKSALKAGEAVLKFVCAW